MRPNTRSQRTHPLIWCLAIICTILTVIVIITGIVVFVGYLAIKPSIPYVSVTQAHLDTFDADQAGVLTTRLTIIFKAENDNSKAHASFTGFFYHLAFDGVAIARLRNWDFDLQKNESKLFTFLVNSDPIPLDPDQMNVVDRSLKQNRIVFDLYGSTRTRWQVGPLGSLRHWLRLGCQLRFQAVGGYITPDSHCNSKSK